MENGRYGRFICFPSSPRSLSALQALFVAAYVCPRAHDLLLGSRHVFRHGAASFMMIFASGFLENGIATFPGNSLADNYNLIFALPSFSALPFCSAFRGGRGWFLSSPISLSFPSLMKLRLLFLLHRALTASLGNGALSVSLAACACIPPLWLPLLEGYPDNGARCLSFTCSPPGSHGEGQRDPLRLILRALFLVFLGFAASFFLRLAFHLSGVRAAGGYWPVLHFRDAWQDRQRSVVID